MSNATGTVASLRDGTVRAVHQSPCTGTRICAEVPNRWRAPVNSDNWTARTIPSLRLAAARVLFNADSTFYFLTVFACKVGPAALECSATKSAILSCVHFREQQWRGRYPLLSGTSLAYVIGCTDKFYWSLKDYK